MTTSSALGAAGFGGFGGSVHSLDVSGGNRHVVCLYARETAPSMVVGSGQALSKI
jgi:hypothetical protein